MIASQNVAFTKQIQDGLYNSYHCGCIPGFLQSLLQITQRLKVQILFFFLFYQFFYFFPSIFSTPINTNVSPGTKHLQK